ncbi:MAG TPA: EAL domain-containing protein [Candidatus Polarisedimenticolaceae bacterium]|nr:EAL domain-containing protein [Candidatus Polarisedimenticolaceae bacterium]
MDTRRPDDALDHFRTGYLKLRSALHDRATRTPAYPLLFDELRAQLERRRRIGVVHVEPANIDLVESLYGWQAFDRTMAGLAAVVGTLRGEELPEGALVSVGSVPADRFVLFVPAGHDGEELTHEALAALAAAVKVRLESASDDEPFATLTPRLSVKVGWSFLSEDPFYRFERRVHAAVEEARSLPDRRAQERDRVWGAELKQIITEARIRTLWQPVVELDSGSVFGFEAFSRGPRDSMFEMPRAMFALSDRVGAAGDLDRLCRSAALREGAEVAARRKLFVNVLPSTLGGSEWQSGAVQDLLTSSGRAPEDVVIEVSERAVGAEAESLAEPSAMLRLLGFGLALDDVGTGRDGGEALERLRPDYLKVDPSVVRGIDGNLVKQEIFATLARQGSAIGAAMVGVGVESVEEAETLRRLGARYAQGYHFAGPAPRERWTS